MQLTLKEPIIRHIGIVLLSIAIPFMIPPDAEIPEHDSFISKVIVAYIFTFTFWQGTYLIIAYYRKKIPSLESTWKRVTATLCMASIFIVIGDFVLHHVLSWLGIADINNSLAQIFSFTKMNFAFFFIIMGIYESAYFFGKWKESVIEAEKLRHQHLRSRFEVLKQQMSPHFLFNSFNTLLNVIDEDVEKAKEFTLRLSEVYRYILQNRQKEIVPLHTELQFAQDFLFLHKMRFGDSLQISIDVADKYLENMYIAPLTLQLLLENAVKHNEVSVAHPLLIEIFVETGKSILVRNNLQRKSSLNAINSTHTGLENIRERYRFLTTRDVGIVVSHNYFTVAIPLLEIEEHKSAERYESIDSRR